MPPTHKLLELALLLLAAIVLWRSLPRRVDPNCSECQRTGRINAHNLRKLPAKHFLYCPTHGGPAYLKADTGHHKR